MRRVTRSGQRSAILGPLIAELKQLWIAEGYRGRGMGRVLLDSFVEEASRRGVRRIWLASYDFQAPLFCERAGFVLVAGLKDWPIGHTNSIFCRTINGE